VRGGRGYANDKQPDKLDVVAVLEIPPVISPQIAVKAAVAFHAKGMTNANDSDGGH
jgi:hypothetical protein